MNDSNRVLKDYINSDLVIESFLWYTFSRVTDEDMVRNLKEYRTMFKTKLKLDEQSTIDSDNPSDGLPDKIEDEMEEFTEQNLDHIRKLVQDLHMDKDSWRKRIGI